MNQNYTKNCLFAINALSSKIKGFKKAFGVNKAVLVFLLFFVQAVVVAQNGPDCPSGVCIGPGTEITISSGISLTISSNAFYSKITVNNGATLIVNPGVTLYVGRVGTASTLQVLDFQNNSTVLIASGASLVVNGRLNNSNNSDSVTFNGSVSVTGNVTVGQGSVISGSGSFDATGGVTGAGTIFGCSTGNYSPVTISSTAATCSAAGTTTISNYNNSNTYTFNPATAGIAINASGLITGMVVGTNYTVTSIKGSCLSGLSVSFSNAAMLATPLAAGTITGTATVCQGQAIVGYAVPVITNATSYTWAYSGTGAAFTNGTTASPTITFANTATSGNLTVYGVNTCGNGKVSANYAVTVNPIPTTPKVGAITELDCVVPKGSVVLTDLPAGNWTINPGGLNGSGSSAVINGLIPGTYNFTVTNNLGCTSATTLNIVIKAATFVTNTWSNGSWDKGNTTTTDQRIVFADDYSKNEDVNACSCVVYEDKTVTIKAGKTMKIVNDLSVLGTLTFENNASLVQIDDNAVNSGNIIYKRTTGAIINTDYVYWSTPVTGAALSAIQTGTLYYSFNAAANSWVRQSASSNMLDGLGYIVRGAGTGSGNGTPFYKTASFIGKPNNGIKNVVISAERSNLIGNPYPSAIDADAFIIKNKEVLSGSLYFWTHKTAIQLATNITNGTAGSGNLAYTSDDYATYNLTGGTGTSATKGTGTSSVSKGLTPSGQIAAGQAFFATAGSAGGTASFDNSMRVSGGLLGINNAQFFKVKSNSKESSPIEKNRVWLNLTNTQGAFKQTLIGYVTGATNNYESAYDGKSLNANAFIDFYSVQNNSKYAIQGRALPFDDNDVVPLGFKSTIAGEFKIGIDQVDGLLSSKKIFIEDKLLGKVQDLSKASYDFSTEKGTFNDRFVLSYANRTLEVIDNIVEKKFGVLIYNKNKEIVIESSEEVIDKVLIYDFLGKQVYRNTNINETDLKVSDLILINNQALIVKVILQNGETITKKIIL